MTCLVGGCAIFYIYHTAPIEVGNRQSCQLPCACACGLHVWHVVAGYLSTTHNDLIICYNDPHQVPYAYCCLHAHRSHPLIDPWHGCSVKSCFSAKAASALEFPSNWYTAAVISELPVKSVKSALTSINLPGDCIRVYVHYRSTLF